MRSSSCGGGGSGRVQGLSRLGSIAQGEQLLPIGSLFGSGALAAPDGPMAALRCSDSSCTGTPVLVHAPQAPASQSPVLVTAAAGTGPAISEEDHHHHHHAAIGDGIGSLLFATSAALQPPAAGAALSAGSGGAASAQALFSTPSRGLSELLCWEDGSVQGGDANQNAAELLGSAPSGTDGLQAIASQELLLEVFRGMQQEGEEGNQQAEAGLVRDVAGKQVGALRVPCLQLTGLMMEDGAAGHSPHPATPGSKRDRSGMPVVAAGALVPQSVPAAAGDDDAAVKKAKA